MEQPPQHLGQPPSEQPPVRSWSDWFSSLINFNKSNAAQQPPSGGKKNKSMSKKSKHRKSKKGGRK